MSMAVFILAALLVAPPDWRKESFDFPLRFAPSIPYQGTEHVRFNPKWDHFDDDAGFSYVVLWDVKEVPIEPADIEDHLETYFNGLMANVARGRKLEAPAKSVSCGKGRMQILFALSKSRRDRPIWNGLRGVRSATTCEPPRS